MEKDEPLDPAEIGRLGSVAVVPSPDRRAHMVRQVRPAAGRDCFEANRGTAQGGHGLALPWTGQGLFRSGLLIGYTVEAA